MAYLFLESEMLYVMSVINTLVSSPPAAFRKEWPAASKIDFPFRLIRAKSKQGGEPILFLTKIKHLNATEISEIYHRRWDIEVFFRFIKQELNFSRLVS